MEEKGSFKLRAERKRKVYHLDFLYHLKVNHLNFLILPWMLNNLWCFHKIKHSCWYKLQVIFFNNLQNSNYSYQLLFRLLFIWIIDTFRISWLAMKTTLSTINYIACLDFNLFFRVHSSKFGKCLLIDCCVY